MNLEPIIFTPEELIDASHKASEAASKAAESTAEYENLKELSDDVLAEIKTSLEPQAGGRSSESKLERLARCNERWKVHVSGLHGARSVAYQDRVSAKNAERYWASIQSALSYIKEGMKRDVI